MPARAGLALVFALTFTATAARAQQPPIAGESFDIRHYAVELDLDVAAGAIAGRERIDLVTNAPATALVFDCGALTVDSVAVGGHTAPFTQTTRRLIVTLSGTVPARATRRVDVTYHGASSNGLAILASGRQAYTTFSTSQWMIAVDAPVDRATLDLDVGVPAGWSAGGSGREISRTTAPNGTTRFHWRLDHEAPSYTFGFVTGAFTEARDAHANVTLRYLGGGLSEADLHRVFHDTAGMLQFFTDRAGVPYPGGTYTQALVASSGGQEMAGLSHLPEAYARGVLADPAANSLAAHELAHQWWGNAVTCRDWTHFWLNEGFATFMAAAYGEQALGRAAYLADVQRWRDRLDRLRAAGADRSLVFSAWNRPSADDRALVYQKGALVLHELRERLGEARFWTAIREYTKAFAGKSVTTAEFQQAVERSSGQRLDDFFAEWVYLTQKPAAAP
jgi:aminopeptidase N